MGASGESATAGASEPAKVAAISSDSLGDGGAKLSGATGEGADGLNAGAVAGAEVADASKQADQPAPKQDTVVGLVDVPGKKATVKEDRIPQTLGGMLPMTLGVDGEGEFDFDKAVVRPEVKALLDKLAAKLKDSEYDTLDIVGHADRLGTEEYNQSLSERRAWAVARYLIAQGVPLQKIRVEGHGVSEPLTKPEDCAGLNKKDAIACLQKDRRVEIAASIRNTEVKVQ
jgi:outer membrane protein OmpA-like peptidoglycan-associated protein